MKLEYTRKDKTYQEVVSLILPVPLGLRKILRIHENGANREHESESSSVIISASISYEIKEKCVQSRIIFTYQQRIKCPNGNITFAKAILPTEDKIWKAILVLSQLSEPFVSVKEIKERYRQHEVVKTAIISNANHDLLGSPGTSLRVERLSQFINRLHLNLSDALLSPAAFIKNLRTKGSAPKESKRRVLADSSNLMFVVLGWSGETPTESIEVFDSSSQKWSFFQRETPFIRAYHGVALVGVCLYVVGGFNGQICLATTLCLNLRSRQWRRKSPMSIARCYVLTVVLEGRIYAIGGHSGMNRLKTCEKFDPNKNKWTRVSDMSYRRSDAAGTEINGKILVSGGFNGFHFHATVEIYDPACDQWTVIGSMINPRSGHCMINYDGYIYVLGGFNGSHRMREVERFAEETNTWETFVPMLTGRSNFCVGVYSQEIFVMGGYDGTQTISSVEKFDRMKMEWQRAPNLNIHRSAAGACVFNNSGSETSCAQRELFPATATNLEERSP